jgi:hypothetical protein
MTTSGTGLDTLGSLLENSDDEDIENDGVSERNIKLSSYKV